MVSVLRLRPQELVFTSIRAVFPPTLFKDGWNNLKGFSALETRFLYPGFFAHMEHLITNCLGAIYQEFPIGIDVEGDWCNSVYFRYGHQAGDPVGVSNRGWIGEV